MNFDKYYFDIYLPKHRHPLTKVFHAMGTLGSFATALYAAAFCWPLLIAAPFVPYPLAWMSHIVFERNKPAAFKNPFWARMADWRMCIDLATSMIDWDTRIRRKK